MQLKNYENNENHIIPNENYENNENLRIPIKNYEMHENHKIPIEKQNANIMKIMKILIINNCKIMKNLEFHARIMKIINIL